MQGSQWQCRTPACDFLSKRPVGMVAIRNTPASSRLLSLLNSETHQLVLLAKVIVRREFGDVFVEDGRHGKHNARVAQQMWLSVARR